VGNEQQTSEVEIIYVYTLLLRSSR